jgi:threonine/homoserine efflux transporter RhtA
MQAIEQYLEMVVSFFLSNWIAAAVLGLIIIVAAIKKPKELFKVTALIALLIGVLYVMIYLEQSMFSGVTSSQKSYDEELRTGGKME